MGLHGGRRLRLADLVDLELQLQRDRSAPLDRLQARDAAIAAAWGAVVPAPREALRTWLDEVRGSRPSAGARIEELHAAVSALLALAGFALGLAGVGGWLLAGTGVPVNVVRFWPAVVGSQLALLVLWCISALPSRWLRAWPGLRQLHALLRALGGLLPAAAEALLARFPSLRAGADATGTELAVRTELLTVRTELRRMELLLGPLQFWLRTRLMQTFAVAFNAGALAAFVSLPYLDDPAFGWRSRLLEPEGLHALASALAVPWSELWPEALPALEVVRATRYSSIDPVFLDAAARSGSGAAWGAWWPFLVASIGCYGLLPRVVLLALASVAARRAIDRASLQHPDLVRLRDRLQRPDVESRAHEATGGPDPSEAGNAGVAPVFAGDLGGQDVWLLIWAGVSGDDEAWMRALRERARGNASGAVQRVGALDPAGDAAALCALRVGPRSGGAVLLVESQEPPVADYLDFLRELRGALAPTAPLLVLLVESRAPQTGSGVLGQRLAQWRRQLGSLADPWLQVGALAAGPTA